MTAHAKSAKVEARTQLAGQKAMNLALQVEEATRLHMGVLDRLLDDERLTFDGISASSGGGSMLSYSPMAWRWRTSGGEGVAEDLLGKDIRPDILKHHSAVFLG